MLFQSGLLGLRSKRVAPEENAGNNCVMTCKLSLTPEQKPSNEQNRLSGKNSLLNLQHELHTPAAFGRWRRMEKSDKNRPSNTRSEAAIIVYRGDG